MAESIELSNVITFIKTSNFMLVHHASHNLEIQRVSSIHKTVKLFPDAMAKLLLGD